MYVYNSTSGNGVVSCHFIMTFITSLALTHGANSCTALQSVGSLVRQSTPSLRKAYTKGFAEGSAEGFVEG